jgi:ubiquitin carboxyl-terminal hydrolase 4/11/15
MFGNPLVMGISARWSYAQLVAAVRERIGGNFVLSRTAPDGLNCAICDRPNCEGCPISAASSQRLQLNGGWLYLAVDWEEAPSPQPVIVVEGKVGKSGNGAKTVTGKVSLYDCLDAFTATESLVGDNRWFCDRCKTKTDAERRTNWERTPDVLVVLLKRFQYTSAGLEKLTVPISFPITDLAIKAGSASYDLYGVVNHFGSLSSGHYTAACLDQASGQWAIFNDHQVINVPTETATKTLTDCAKSCYVLFYRRQDTRTANVINYAPLTTDSL